MPRVAIVLAVLALAHDPNRRVTGVTSDWTEYLVGKSTICGLSLVDIDGTTFPPTCRDATRNEVAARHFGTPVESRSVKLPDGRTLVARVREERSKGGPGGCLTTRDHPCNPVLPPETFATLEIVAVGAKDQTVLARYDQDVTRVLALHAAADGTRLLVAYERRQLLRNLGDPEVVADVVGLDLTRRLGR